ncbi:cytochrome P450 [Streptomyces sp. RP5T]|uniref:cytochrome P450 n=1 Tax=Streptomyces sp. RP5T TaxID=2490848 RepID=UPI000F6510D4|nr:cytochrome P450 [Streptomyces sp. RP5T]RRR75559.1 cytochrome P450 [Streptomyces sp. RP5T]
MNRTEIASSLTGLRAGCAPHAWPILGHLPQMQSQFLNFLDALPDIGDIVEIKLGTRSAFVLCNAELTRQVLVDFQTFDRSGKVWDRVRDSLGNGLPSAPNAEHHWQRRLVQPMFRRDYLREYAKVMQQEISSLTKGWLPGRRIEIGDEMFKLSANVTLRTLFDAELKSDAIDELREIFSIWADGILFRQVVPFWTRLPTAGNRRYAKAIERWRFYANSLISRQREDLEDSGNLLAGLLEHRTISGQPLTDSELSDHVAVLILAGIKTTSIALTWCLYLLGENPSTQQLLQRESDSVLAGKSAGWEDLPNLPYANAVVQEALRLYPPAFIQPRTVTKDIVVAGRSIDAGSTVIYSPYILHRRDDHYVNPEKFDPTRWLPGHQSKPSASRGTFIPFGLGATKCVGDKFAVTEAALALASFYGSWNIQRDRSVSVRPIAKSILHPSRFVAIPFPRNPHES